MMQVIRNYKTKPRKLYRVEHPKTGEGPLWDCGSGFDVYKYCDSKYPTPYDECLPFEDEMCVATRSKKQLKYWFNKKDMKNLAELGFKVVTYSIKDKSSVHSSKHQVTFYKYAVQVEDVVCPREFK
jgi:hypothetical protein